MTQPAPTIRTIPALWKRAVGMIAIVSTITLGVALSLSPTRVEAVPVSADFLPPPTSLATEYGAMLGYRIPLAAYRGVSSCAAASCHGGDHPKQVVGNEHGTWVSYDPHAGAHSLLYNKESQRILRLFRDIPEGESARAHKDALCIKCHSVDATVFGPSDPHSIFGSSGAPGSLADGVGCEGCHGPAEHYLSVHYQPWWNTLSRQQKANDYGMYPTDDIAFRAMTCARCHVGAPGQEVDHRLIASGHPALRFEYTSHHYSPKLTRHWAEEDYGPDFEARAWAIGEIAAARSSVALLKHRTEHSTEWPELAEYNCFSCHHRLEPRSWRQQDEPRSGRLGFMPWNTWHAPIAGRVAEEIHVLDPSVGGHQLEELDRLADLLQGGNLNRDVIRAQADEALRELDSLLVTLQQRADAESHRHPYSSAEVAAMFTRLTESARADGLTWDESVQHYLSLAALYHGLTNQDRSRVDPGLREQLENIAETLSFPPGQNSPARGFNPEIFRERIGGLRTNLSLWE